MSLGIQLDLLDTRRKGVTCEHCGAKLVEYRFTFNKGLAVFLRRLFEAGAPDGKGELIMNAFQIAEEAIGLFLEYRDKHGYNEEDAKAKALCEILDGLNAMEDHESEKA